ncbi:MAG: succinate dehydrogenase, hydrophobic membrane anchor protein [Gammaproteobacteria bacterium]|nr:succinate dehydrogenase, hydrophobic membrane anchor protein [Gammaproteobacteria bacterium]
MTQKNLHWQRCLFWPGVRDWLIQRTTAVILALYTILIFLFFITHSHVTFEAWRAFWHHPFVQIMTFLSVMSIAFHTWIGFWTIFEDYVKPIFLKFALEVGVFILIVWYSIWTFQILWSSS